MALIRTSLIGVIALGVLASAGQVLAQTPAAAREARRISVDEAVRIALEQNMDIQVQRLNPQLQDLALAVARTAWAPSVTASLSNGHADTPSTSIFSGAAGKLTRSTFGTSIGASQLFPWGATGSASWGNTRLKSNSIFDSPNPSLGSSFSLSYAHPLMRNRVIDSARQQVQVTRLNKEVSEIQLRQTVASIVRNVKRAYWELVFAVSSLEVQKQSLDLAQASERNARSKIAVGTMAAVDLVDAQSEVAQREEAVIVAEAALAQAEDRLRALVFDPASPGFWSMTLQPADPASLTAASVDADAAVTTAVAKRLDLAAAKKNLEVADVSIKYFDNQRLPDVKLQLDYGLAAQGGTTLLYGSGFPPPVTGQQSVGYPSVLKSLLLNDFPAWSVAVSVAYPVGNSPASANLARTRVQKTQTETEIRNLELQVAMQVRDVARQVNADVKRIDATRAARGLAEKKLEAEEKRFAAGRSTTFLVFQAQRDLSLAKNAELRALLDYSNALVDFETVQQAPTVGGAPITFGGGVQ